MNRATTASISALSPNFDRTWTVTSGPTELCACEVEALAWSTSTGWGTAPGLGLSALWRAIGRTVFRTPAA